jgi:alpha,alpha-trehalase
MAHEGKGQIEMSDTSPPSELFGALFEAVQTHRLYGDSKSFADAIPLRLPVEIMADWKSAQPSDASELRAFVEENFALPEAVNGAMHPNTSFKAYLAQAWSSLVRSDREVPPFGSALSLPYPFVVPGGRFRELYYWDSYFTMLGLAVSGRQELVEDMVENLGSMLDRFGMIPNASRTYYLSRSHPPVFYLAAGLSRKDGDEDRARRLEWMRKEHRFWMDGADDLLPGHEHRRVARLADGALLNRYWDDHPVPRDESWAEDMALARVLPEEQHSSVWRNLRAAAESGWDFSSRWLGQGGALHSIRTTRILPVDLNALLYGLEQTIAEHSAAQGHLDEADLFREKAHQRLNAVNAYLWSAELECYADYDIDIHSSSGRLTAAAAFPLFVGLSDGDRARSTAVALHRLLSPGGLCTTLDETGQQWDAPNGWGPLQWIAFKGLQAYGEGALAADIAQRWLAMVERDFQNTGQIFEKYDVETQRPGVGGEYAVEIGFGWTNGVTLALMDATARR